MKQYFRKTVSVVLSLIMALSVFGGMTLTAFADDTFSGDYRDGAMHVTYDPAQRELTVTQNPSHTTGFCLWDLLYAFHDIHFGSDVRFKLLDGDGNELPSYDLTEHSAFDTSFKLAGGAIAYTDVFIKAFTQFLTNLRKIRISGFNSTGFDAFGFDYDSVRIYPSGYLGDGRFQLPTADAHEVKYANLNELTANAEWDLELTDVSDSIGLWGSEFKGCMGLKTLTVNGAGEINYAAFKDCKNLQTVSLSNVGAVGSQAFRSCTALKNLSLVNVDNIGNGAFSGDTNLSGDLVLNAEVIGSGAFMDCRNLKTLKLESGVKIVYSSAFRGCSMLERVTIDAPNCAVDKNVFSDDAALYYANLNCASIGSGAFSGTALSRLTLTDNVKEIKDWAFSGCAQLTSAAIPAGVTSLGQGAFSDCGLTSVSFAQTASAGLAIEAYAFANNPLSGTLTLPGNVSKIGDFAFAPDTEAGASQLTEIVIPAGSKPLSIGSQAFANLENLEKITVPDNANAIADSALWGVPDSVEFRCGYQSYAYQWALTHGFTPVVGSGSTGQVSWTLEGAEDGLELHISGIGNTGSYFIGNDPQPWDAYADDIARIVIDEGVRGIGDQCFIDCQAAETISIPNSVTSIGFHAIPSGVAVICDSASYAHTWAQENGNPIVTTYTITVGYDAPQTLLPSVVSGGGAYPSGVNVTVTAGSLAQPRDPLIDEYYEFTGWYKTGENGALLRTPQLVSTDRIYTFPASANITLKAKYETLEAPPLDLGSFREPVVGEAPQVDLVVRDGAQLVSLPGKLAAKVGDAYVNVQNGYVYEDGVEYRAAYRINGSGGPILINGVSCATEEINRLPYVTYYFVAHNFTTDEIAATCTSTGRRVYVSADPDYECTFSDVLPATGHTPEVVNETPATCLDDGATEYECSVCGATLPAQTIPAAGHDLGDWIPEVPAVSCVEPGEVGHYECAVCGAWLDADENEIADRRITLPHTFSVTLPNRRSCVGEAFYMDSANVLSLSVCDGCGQFLLQYADGTESVVSEDVVLPFVTMNWGHKYDNGVCVVCGDVQTEYAFLEPLHYGETAAGWYTTAVNFANEGLTAMVGVDDSLNAVSVLLYNSSNELVGEARVSEWVDMLALGGITTDFVCGSHAHTCSTVVPNSLGCFGECFYKDDPELLSLGLCDDCGGFVYYYANGTSAAVQEADVLPYVYLATGHLFNDSGVCTRCGAVGAPVYDHFEPLNYGETAEGWYTDDINLPGLGLRATVGVDENLNPVAVCFYNADDGSPMGEALISEWVDVFASLGIQTALVKGSHAHADEDADDVCDLCGAELSVELTDAATSVTVSAPASVLPDEAVLTVVPDASVDAANIVIADGAALSGKEHEAFDITLLNGSGDAVQPNGEVEVRIPVPAGYSDNIKVYYVDGANNATEIPCRVEDGFVIFTTDHFSVYTVVDMTCRHDYGEPVWTWTEDFTAAVSFTCARCGDVQTPDVTVTSATTAPTAMLDGKTVYTATVEFEGETYTAVKEKILPATGDEDPSQPPVQPEEPAGDNICKWDNVDHGNTFWGRIVKFFHSIAYFFAHLFGKR